MDLSTKILNYKIRDDEIDIQSINCSMRQGNLLNNSVVQTNIHTVVEFRIVRLVGKMYV